MYFDFSVRHERHPRRAMPTPILLVRSPRKPAHTDPYSSAFSSLSHLYDIHHLPILETSFLNVSRLSSIIAAGAEGKYSGVIICSVRSAEAWTMGSARGKEKEIGDWSKIPFFVVGPATKDAVVVMTQGEGLQTNQLVIGAKETGSGEKLGQFVVDHFQSTDASPAPKLPLLYLVGDKNRDTIRRILKEAEIPLENLQVYETHPSPTFESSLDSFLTTLKYSPATPIICWFTLFSPSGSKPCLDALRNRGLIDSIERKGKNGLEIRFAVIGPTTREYVEVDEGVTVHADAKSPDPKALVRAIKEFHQALNVEKEIELSSSASAIE